MSAARRILYVDATAGASGDMILGAFVDLGVPLAMIRRAVASLPVDGWRLAAKPIVRHGLAARKVDVAVTRDQPARDWRDIRRIVAGGSLEPEIRDRALAVFRRLFEAEAEVHGTTPEKVHLHEAGAVDAIVDIVGASVALAHFGPESVVVSPLTTGFGSVVCEHGTYPVPAPATALLVRGVPVQGGDIEGERLTPTGAAVLTCFADSWGPFPLARPRKVGYGAGTRTFPGTPNFLRMILADGAGEETAPRDRVLVLEVTIDDAPPQVLAFASERLFDAGALEVYTAPVHMKKGRTGHHMTVLARPEDRDGLAEVLFRETTTLGLRFREEGRIELARRIDTVKTAHGRVRVKIGEKDGQTLQVWPEYADCAAIAKRDGISLRDVQRTALDAYRTRSARSAVPRRKPR